MKEVRVTTIFRADDLVNQKFAFFSYLNAYRVYAAMRKESKIKETNREKRTRESRIRLMRHDRTIRRSDEVLGGSRAHEQFSSKWSVTHAERHAKHVRFKKEDRIRCLRGCCVRVKRRKKGGVMQRGV